MKYFTIDELTASAVEFPGGLDGIWLGAELSQVEARVARVEDERERRAVDCIDELQRVDIAHAAVVHAVLVAIDDSVVLADLHEFADLREDDALQLG